MNKITKSVSNAIERSRLQDKPFALISNNCWGYELYNALGREYNTPFVGLFLFAECYIQFLENFETCINSELKFSKTSKHMSGAVKYPVGLLCGHIEVHFLHYASEAQALEKWNRRSARLRDSLRAKVPLFVKFCDRDGCTDDHIARFHALPFEHKISIGINKFKAVNHLSQPQLKDPNGNFVIDGAKLYRKRYHYFDIADWISSGKVSQSLTSKCLALIS